MLKPSQTCCGCFSLLAGVQFICLLSIVTNVLIIALTSSTEPIQFLGLVISPFIQISAATWSFLGLPIAVAAGVGAMHRIEANVRLFMLYAACTLIPAMGVPLSLVFSGSVCNATISPELQRMGSAFVCGFTDAFVFMWTLVMGIFQAYTVYVLWSAAEEIQREPYPELLRYQEVLKHMKAHTPTHEGGYVLNGQDVGYAEDLVGPPSFVPGPSSSMNDGSMYGSKFV